MRRPLFLPLVSLLTLATGLGLLGLAATVAAPPGDATRAQANEATVRRFYAAANTALRIGDTRAVEPLIAADLVEHPARPDLPAGRDGLVRALAAMHMAHPTLQLVVEEINGTGDQVVARVRIEGVTDGAPAPWGAADAFRLADGRIVEHRGVSPGPTAAPAGRRAVTIERRTYKAGVTHLVAATNGAVVVAPEAGALEVRIGVVPPGPATGEGPSLPASIIVAPGDTVMLPEGAVATVRAWGGKPTEVLAMTLAWHAGAGSTALSSDPVESARITLAAGEERPARILATAELVLVEDGVLGLASVGPAGWSRVVGSAGAMKSWTGQVVETSGLVAAGDGVLLPAGSTVTWYNPGPGPLTLLVVAILTPPSAIVPAGHWWIGKPPPSPEPDRRGR